MKLKLTKPRIITSGIVIITLIAAMIALPNLLKKGDDVYAYMYREGYAITAENTDSTGVAIDSSFLLTTNLVDIELTTQEVNAHLSLSPEIGFTLSQVEEGVRITLNENLEHQSIYTWTYKGISFSFQTQSDFMLLGTLPRHETTNVPVTTGIEFYMSHAGAQVDDVFSIEPAVNGKFENHGNVVVFVPTGGLQEKTIYSVTLKSGMGLTDSDKTIDDSYSFSFETGLKDETSFKEPKGYLSFNNILNDFSTSEIPAIPMNVSIYQKETQQSIQTTLYQFEKVTDVVEALHQYESLPIWSTFGYETFSIETEGLKQMASFDLPLPVADMYPQVMNLPENLPAGYYLVDARWEELHVQTFIQVTDLSYTMIEDDASYYFWVHDLSTGLEAQQVNLLSPTGESGITDEAGIGQIKKIKRDDTNTLSVIRLQGQYKEAIALSMNWNQRYMQDSNTQYWRYLQTDRGLYQPKDTVNFFGFLKSRYAASTAIKEVTVELTQGNFYFYAFMPFFREQDALVRERIPVNQGFFEGEIELPSLEAGYYQIQVKWGDDILATQSFQVEAYVKPDYKIEVLKDKEALFVDETVVFHVNTAFFEGTPVANLDVNYQVGATNQQDEKRSSDENGQFSVQYTPTYSSNYQGEVYGYFTAFATLPESGEIYGNTPFRVFVNDMHVKVESRLEQESGTIMIEAHGINLERLNNGTAEDSEDYLDGVLPGVVFDGDIMRNEWIKTEIGEVYDFINKETRKEYRYDLKTTQLQAFSVTTNELGQANYEVNLPKEPSVYYHVVLKTKDQQSRPMKFENYFGSYDWMYPNDGSYIELKMDKENYQIDETISLSLNRGENEVDKGQYLYIVAQNGIKDLVISNESTIDMDFDESFVPNVEITAVVFNGKTYQTSSPAMPRIDLETKNMAITMTTDKENYLPGDEVTVTLEATFEDKTGQIQKVKDGRILISLVDEALLALSDQQRNALESLYEWVNSGVTQINSSHKNQNFNMPRVYGGYGGYDKGVNVEFSMEESKADTGSSGSGISVRSDFKDTALFKLLELDENGKSSYSFKLPDNITSWRLVASGISQSLRAGTTVENVLVSLPFFINSTLSTTYLVGDKPSIGLVGYGKDVTADTTIQYEVTLNGVALNTSGKAYARSLIDLGELSEGEHTVTIKATTDTGLIDALEEKIKVVKSYQVWHQANYQALSPGVKLTTTDQGLSTLTFIDEGQGRYLPELYELSYEGGRRIDQRVVAQLARRLLKETFGIETEDTDVAVMDYFVQEGGLSILPYAMADLQVTALLSELIQEDVPANRLEAYLTASYYSSNEKAVALYGLTNLGKPMLLEMNQLLMVNNRSLQETLYLALSYAKIGDNYMARKLYEESVIKQLKSFETTAYIQGDDDNETLKLTALALLLSARIGLNETDKFNEYVKVNTSKEVYISVEKLLAIKALVEKANPTPGSITYAYEGETVVVDLSESGSNTRILPSSKVEELRIISVTGTVGVVMAYEKLLSEADSLNDMDEGLRATREYFDYATNTKSNTFKSGDIVKVVINATVNKSALDATYRIIDFAPAGLAPLKSQAGVRLLDANYWYREVDGQKVTFYIGRDDQYQEPLYYYARIISPGEFRADGLLIQGVRYLDSYWLSDEQSIKINE